MCACPFATGTFSHRSMRGSCSASRCGGPPGSSPCPSPRGEISRRGSADPPSGFGASPTGPIPASARAPTAPPPDPALAALGLAPPYFLFVGNPLPHKNLPRLLDAFAGLPPALGSLVLAGIPSGARAGVMADCRARRLDGRVKVLAPVDSGTMPSLYRGALAVVCPSLWEGFGLPALEALACGTPVLVSDRGALPEVVGGAGRLVDPTDVDALREGMYTLAVHAPLRAELRAAGLVRARAFSWEHTAEATIAVYREAWQALGTRKTDA